MIQPQEISFHTITILCHFIQFHVYYNIDIILYSTFRIRIWIRMWRFIYHTWNLELLFVMETLCFMFLWLHNFGAGERDVVWWQYTYSDGWMVWYLLEFQV